MSDILEEMRIEVAKVVVKEIKEETTRQVKTESVLRWLQKGMPIEDIAYCIDLPIEQVEAIAAAHQLDLEKKPIQQ